LVAGKRMLPQMGRKLRKTAEGALAQMMLESFDVGKMLTVIEAQELKEIGEHGVAFADFFRHPAPFRCERKAAIRLVAEKAELAEPLDHDRGAGPVQAQGLGDVGDAGVALGVFEIENAFEVILHAFAHPGAIMGAAFAGGKLRARAGTGGRFDGRPSHGGKLLEL